MVCPSWSGVPAQADLTAPCCAALPPPRLPAPAQELVGLFNYLEFCLKQVVQDNELGALKEVGALRALCTLWCAVSRRGPQRAGMRAVACNWK